MEDSLKGLVLAPKTKTHIRPYMLKYCRVLAGSFRAWLREVVFMRVRTLLVENRTSQSLGSREGILTSDS